MRKTRLIGTGALNWKEHPVILMNFWTLYLSMTLWTKVEIRASRGRGNLCTTIQNESGGKLCIRKVFYKYSALSNLYHFWTPRTLYTWYKIFAYSNHLGRLIDIQDYKQIACNWSKILEVVKIICLCLFLYIWNIRIWTNSI